MYLFSPYFILLGRCHVTFEQVLCGGCTLRQSLLQGFPSWISCFALMGINNVGSTWPATQSATQAAGGRWVQFGVRISLITSFRDTCFIEITPVVQKSKREIYLSFWAEVHYNSIYSVGGEWFHHFVWSCQSFLSISYLDQNTKIKYLLMRKTCLFGSAF